jgi:parvulin-like peptidyl-prolyl isomerase
MMTRARQTIVAVGLSAVLLVAIGLWTEMLCYPKDQLPLQVEPARRETGSGAQHPAAEIVATVNGRPITADAVRQEMIRRGADFLGGYDELEEKEALLEDVVRTEVLAQAAEQAGYDKDPEVVEATKRLMAQKYWAAHMGQVAVDEAEVTGDEVRTYYEQHRERWTTPERARGAVILLRFPPNATAEQQQAVREKAAAVLKEAKRQPPAERLFGSLAAAHSDDTATKLRGGDIGWIPKGGQHYRWDDAVVAALFSIADVGGLAAPVETARGVCLVKLVDRDGGGVDELAELAPRIRSEIANERRRSRDAREYAALRAQYDVTVDRDRLERVGPRRTDVAGAHGPPLFPVGEKAQGR